MRRLTGAARATWRFVRRMATEHGATVGFLILTVGVYYSVVGVRQHADDSAHAAKVEAVARTNALNGAVVCIKDRVHDAVTNLAKVPPGTSGETVRRSLVADLDRIQECRIIVKGGNG